MIENSVAAATKQETEMDKFSHFIQKNPLFHRVPPDSVEHVLQCLGAFSRTYDGHTLLHQTDSPIPFFGMVLKGSVEIFLSSPDGASILISRSEPGELFGQALTVGGLESILFEIYASEGSEILFLHVPEFTSLKNCRCTYRFIVMENLMKLIAEDNMELMMKIRILTQTSLRKKLLLYFSLLAARQGSCMITLPFGRDKLSLFLACDRSALSREMGKMKKDGLIDFKRKTVTLKCTQKGEFIH